MQIGDVNKARQAIDTLFLEHIDQLTNRWRSPNSIQCSRNDIQHLGELDERLKKITDCPELIEELNEESSLKVNGLIEDLWTNLERFYDEEATSLTTKSEG